VAQADSLAEAYQRAYMADRVAAFGGCIALNRAVDKATAEAVANQYAEVVVAPEFEDGSLAILGQRKNLRVIRIQAIEKLQNFVGERVVDFKSLIDGGVIAQWSFAPVTLKTTDLKLATSEYQGRTYTIAREPTAAELDDLLFGWLVESGLTSNSVIYVKDRCTVGIGTGEQDRVGVAEIARDKAYRKLADRYCYEELGVAYNELEDNEKKKAIDARVDEEKGGLPGASMVSDAFFPFRDGVMVGIREGIRAVVQPGGAMNDWNVIEACNEAGVTMVFTGQRSFKH
jgi:phosphoribosylaminoimidazolecarboxamide formyltransferase/IMP cyclohydrolase